MPELTLEFFQKQGRRGGKMGGALAWANLTPEQRSARAKHAVSQRKWHAVKPADETAKKPKAKAKKKAAKRAKKTMK
jgi:hypothetical protein